MTRIKTQMMRNSLRGFSLVEIMVVVTLVAIFVGLGTVYFMGQLDKGKIDAARQQSYEIAKALDLYKLQTGAYPSSSEGLDVLVNPARGQAIMTEIPKDPWGRDYNFANPGTHNQKGFDVWSDGPSGDGGENAVGNWRDE